MPFTCDVCASVDVNQQRIDGGAAAGSVLFGPAVRAKPSADVLLGPFSKLTHRLINRGRARLFGHGVAGAQHSRGPGVLTFQGGGRGERCECVDECELVVQFTAADQTFAGVFNGRVGLSSLHRKVRPDIERQIEEPRARLLERRRGLIEQALGGDDVARGEGHAGHPHERIADAPRSR